MEFSECCVTETTLLLATSTPSSTLMTGPPDTVGTVKRRTLAEICEKDASMDCSLDSIPNMVIIGYNCSRAFLGTLNSCTSSMAFSGVIINDARHRRAACISSVLWNTAAGKCVVECHGQVP